MKSNQMVERKKTMSLSRPDTTNPYPRPQFVRHLPAAGKIHWMSLNGLWQFEIDQGDSGLERGLLTRKLGQQILVPYCPESEFSGVHNSDFLNAVWYRKTVKKLPKAWTGQRILLHFQAVDYDATVWAKVGDGEYREVARHRGGQTPISCDLGVVRSNDSSIVVRARDDANTYQPLGKEPQ